MAVLTPTRVTSDRFTTTTGHEGEKLLVAEMSDFGRDFRFGRVYDDACDVGLTIVSRRTGREVVFAVDREFRDREGELLWVELVPANLSERGLCRVRLYND